MAKYTMIDELPDISDLESDVMLRRERVKQPLDQSFDRYESAAINKFIRPSNHNLPSQSGMNGPRQMQYPQQPQIQSYYNPPQMENFEQPQPALPMVHDDTNCLSASNHVTSCPVCSRLYKTDMTIYIIAIAILIVICLLLLKRILDI